MHEEETTHGYSYLRREVLLSFLVKEVFAVLFSPPETFDSLAAVCLVEVMAVAIVVVGGVEVVKDKLENASGFEG
jgi:hypothetical protein